MRKMILSLALWGAVLVFTACAASPAPTSGGLHYGETPQMPFSDTTPEPRPESNRSANASSLINRANIYSADESLEQDGLLLENLRVRKSKEMPSDILKENFKFFHFGDATDKDLTLTGAVSYLFLDMDATNIGETDLSFTWNSMRIFPTDDRGALDNSIMLTPWEMRYRSGENLDPEVKDFYRQDLASGETVHITVGYILDDSHIDSENLYFTPAAALSAGAYGSWKLYRLNKAE